MEFKILNTLAGSCCTEARHILQESGEVVDFDGDQQALAQAMSGFQVVLAGIGYRFDRHVLERCPELELLAVVATGLDHVDFDFSKERGIRVIGLAAEEEFLRKLTATAELALGLMISLTRMIPHAFDEVKNGRWERERFRGRMLSGKCLGIVGLGRLGTLMARYGRSLGMQVVACSPYTKADVFVSEGVQPMSLEALCAHSDFISVHAKLTAETENMFDKRIFNLMRPGVCLINTARGRIVKEADLLDALHTGRLGGYATDVLADEIYFEGKKFPNNALVEYAKTHSNFIVVPHIGGMTYESRAAAEIFIARKIADCIKNFSISGRAKTVGR